MRIDLNQTTRDWHTRTVTLSEAKGLAVRFFATLRMTIPSGHIVKCTNVLCFDLGGYALNYELAGSGPETVTLTHGLASHLLLLDFLKPGGQSND